MTFSVPTPVGRQFPVIRVFVSSTFSDLVAERNALAEHVWPKLEDYCRQRGFTFQAIDLRWGVPSEAGLDHRTMQICLEELNRAQATSPEPNFLILLGNKYGWRPLPETISTGEFAELLTEAYAIDATVFETAAKLLHQRTLDSLTDEEQRLWHLDQRLQGKSFSSVLKEWYRHDSNSQPPHHLLRARTDSPDGQDYTNPPGSDGKRSDTQAWLNVQETLWSIINRAYSGKKLVDRFKGGTEQLPSIARFQSSATEQEIWHGALQVKNAHDHVVAWFREIDRTGGDPKPSQLKRFLDLRPDQSVDKGAADALDQLKAQVRQQLAPEPITPAVCRWAKADGTFTGEVTADHLDSMCEDIRTRLQAIILRQINAYWDADLSAKDASAAALRGSPRELDLELRDHGRFAEERGPLKQFVGRENEVRKIREYFQAATNRPFIVHGPSGSGKTALLAYVAQQPFEPGTKPAGASPLILTRFLGTHPESCTLHGLLTSLCRELRRDFPVTTTQTHPDGSKVDVPAPLPDTVHKLLEEFYAQLAHATPQRPIYVFLDALDQLDAADAAREVDWIRSPLLRQADPSAPVHARLVASCLSPSPEFPPDSESCRPYVRLDSRQLLAGSELGALETADARSLLRSWLTAAHRGLTKGQWRVVDAAIAESAIEKNSSRRQPLYLKVLANQLPRWREFDDDLDELRKQLPQNLSQLLELSLRRLSEPSQHGVLPRIALGYLVSARYGLSEGELLEVLFSDPEIADQLKKSQDDYGHELPKEPQRYPIAPWARLRSELRPYLSERAAPGTTVLSCYHRQVEQAVQALFLANDAVHTDCLHRLAKYFDDRWDRPDIHSLVELPHALLKSHQHTRLLELLSTLRFPAIKAHAGLVVDAIADYSMSQLILSTTEVELLRPWASYLQFNAAFLHKYPAFAFQMAYNEPKNSPVSRAARAYWETIQSGGFMRPHSYVPAPAAFLESTNRTPASGEFQHTFIGHTKSVTSIAHAPNRNLLVSGARDGTVRIWDVTTAIPQKSIQLTGGNVTCVSCTCDARLIATEVRVDRASGAFQFDWGGSPDLEIRNASTEAPVHTLSGHQLPSVGIRISADGRRAVSADESGVVIVWDLQSQTHTSLSSRRLSGDVNFAVSADFSTAVVGSSGNDLTIWDITTSTRKIPVPRSFSDGTQCYLVSCLALSGDGKVIAVGAGGIVYVWWIERDSPVRKIVLPNSAARAMSIAISPSGSWLAVGLNDSLGIELFHCDDLKHSKTLLGQAGTITSLVIGDNDRTLFSGSTDATIQAWDTDKPGDSPTNDLASVDDEINDASVMTWLCRHRVPVTCGSVTEDGTLFVTGDAAGVINVWDASTGMVQSQLLGHKQSVNALKVASDARLVLSGGGDSFAENDNSIRLWRLSDGMCVHTLHDHGTPVTAVDIKSDGTMFASGSRDGSVLVGNLVTARGLWLKYPHALSSTTPCVSIAATPNWRFLVAGWQSSHGGSVAMWDVESGKERWRADHVPDGVAEVGIAASGQLVVTRSRSGTVQVWDVDLNKCVNSATGDTGRIVWYAVMRPNEAVWAAQCFADHVAFYEAGRRTWSEVPAPAVALVFPGRFTFAIGTADGCFGMAFRPNGEHIHLRRTERCFYT